jgi:hypothetical protein
MGKINLEIELEGFDNLIWSCIYELLLLAKDTDLYLIGVVGSRYDTLTDDYIYVEMEGWLEDYAETKNRRDLIDKVIKRKENDNSDLDVKIKHCVIDIFDLVGAKDISSILESWDVKRGNEDVYKKLENEISAIVNSRKSYFESHPDENRRYYKSGDNEVYFDNLENLKSLVKNQIYRKETAQKIRQSYN